MAINIQSKVAERLKLNPGERVTARDLANWIFATYPNECEEKKKSSRQDLQSDADLIQQLVAEIGAYRPAIEKKWKQVRTTSDRPRLYYWTDATDAAEVAFVESSSAAAVALGQPPKKEHDLYPLLTTFLWAEWHLHSRRIDEKTASNKLGPGGNRWLFPDLVAMEDLTRDLVDEVRTLFNHSPTKKVRLWAFEVKLLLNRSNVREAFFQTVSNSSWANFGYLVAADIETDEAKRELRMLSALHGVGVIRLDKDNPTESEVLIPARERPEVDWANANRLADENSDFRKVIKVVRQFHQTGDAHEKEWDRP